VVNFRRSTTTTTQTQGTETGNGGTNGEGQKEEEEDSSIGLGDERKPLKTKNSSVMVKMPQSKKCSMTTSAGGAEWDGMNGGGGAGGPSKVGFLAAQTIAKARQNAKRQAALILAAYLAFWSPYNLLAIINAWAQKEGTIREISSASLPFLNSLIVVNPIVNPLIYGVFDECRHRK
jgi:hypothetical protein